MTGDDLSWFQIAVRALLVFALVSYAAVGAVRLFRRFGGVLSRRPRVVRTQRHRELMRRR